MNAMLRSGIRRLTDAERERIVELRERNWTIEAIARHVGCGLGTVQHWCLMRGAEPRKVAPPRTRRHLPFMRNGRPVNPFTAVEDAMLLVLDKASLSYSEISRRMTAAFPGHPRNPATIKYRLMMLARAQERQERRREREVVKREIGS